MKIKVIDGQGVIRIFSDGFSNCIKIKEIVANNWPDCSGSIGEYYAVSKFSTIEKSILSKELNDALNTGKDKETLGQMEHFLKLFSSGEYYVNLYKKYHSPFEIETDQEDFTANFYPWNTDYLLSTIPKDKINNKRVEFYKQAINNGNRPIVIIYSHSYPNSRHLLIVLLLFLVCLWIIFF